MDDDRLARMGSFSAVCSPPLSMMFKGRMSKSSKSKKIELTDELDDEICDALCKISKSSEELWKEVSTIFSPPTPIGSKVSDYTPFDPYKSASTASTNARPPGDHEGDHANNALALLANTSGDRSSLAVTRQNASQSAFNAPQFLTPYPPNSMNKTHNLTGATVPNSIPIPQIVVSKDNEKKDASSHHSDAGNLSTSITSLKRPKRTRSDHLAPGNAVKKPLSGKGGVDGKLNAANINSIINNNTMSDSDGSTASADSHEDNLDTHNQHRNQTAHHANQANLQLQSMALSSLNNISGLFNNLNHNTNNTNNFGNFNSHSHSNSNNQNQNNHNHNHNHNHNNNDSSAYYNNNSNNNNSHSHNNLGNNNNSNANTSMNNFGTNNSMYNSNSSNSGNHNNFSTWNDANGGSSCSNCSCNNSAHNHNNNNTNATNNGNGNGNNSNNNNTANNSGINLSNLTGLTGNFSTNDKYWTEVIFCCKKLVALAGSGLAGPLSFSELVDALTLARHIMSTTAAVINSGAYTPFPSTPIADEFNRLVGETFGNFAHNLTNSNSNTSSNLHTNLLNLNANANNHTYPFFAQGSSTPSSLPLPHSALTPPSPSPSYSHPDTPPSPSLSMSSPLSNMGSSSSWGSGSSYAFDESRRKLPVPIPVPKDESSDEDEDDESPVSSPPPMSPLNALSVVPISPSLSPSTASEKHVKEKDGKEVKEKEGKEGNWKKPRGKKRPKYEADLMCLSCGVRQTPEWRRGPAGAKTLCNACGLHWAKVLKAEGKGDQKKAALLEAKRSQFMLAAQKRSQGSGSATSSALIKSEPLYLSPHLSSH